MWTAKALRSSASLPRRIKSTLHKLSHSSWQQQQQGLESVVANRHCRSYQTSSVVRFPRQVGIRNPSDAEDGGESGAHAVWEDYVKSDADNGALEKSYLTNFGLVRMDKDNVPQFHGQQDTFEEDGGSAVQFQTTTVSEQPAAAADQQQQRDHLSSKQIEQFENDTFLEEPVAKDSKYAIRPKQWLQNSNKARSSSQKNHFSSKEKPKSNSKKLSQKQPLEQFVQQIKSERESKSAKADAQDKADEQSDINWPLHSNGSQKIDQSGFNASGSTKGHQQQQDLGEIDQQFFGSLSDLDTNRGTPVSSKERTKTDDVMSEIDEQFFSSVREIDDVTGGVSPPPPPTTPLPPPDNDLNVIDRQMFGHVDDDVTGLSNDVTNKEKRKSKKSSSAMSFLSKSANESADGSSSAETRNQRQQRKKEDIEMLNKGIANRLFRVATKDEKESWENGDDDDAAEVTSQGAKGAGRVEARFLPVDLQKMPLSEVQDIFNKGVAFNDYDLVALNKPYGLPMFGSESNSKFRMTVEKLLPGLADHLGVEKLHQVHRLDKQTTGILLLAKTEKMHNTLTNWFRQKRIGKQYWAILNGTPNPDQGIIKIPLSEGTQGKGKRKGGGDQRFRMVLRPDYSASDVIEGKRTARGDVSSAVSEYRVLKERGNASLVLVKPVTGVKHQIRAHLGFGLNTPVLGDHKYSDIRGIGKPQRVHGDILRRLGVSRQRSRDLPLLLHSKKVFLPRELREEFDGNSDHGKRTAAFSVDCGLPLHFVKIMKKLRLSPSQIIH